MVEDCNVHMGAGVQAHVGCVWTSDLVVTTTTHAFEQLCATAAEAQRNHAEAPSIGAIEGVQAARTLFRASGLDPTRTRPSSEALLRRALKGKPMPKINPLVDVINWSSLQWLLPIGLYDADRIDQRITLCPGKEGERYLALNGREIHTASLLVLADEHGPFGSPFVDSRRAATSDHTQRALAVVFAPLGTDASLLATYAVTLGQRIVEACGGVVVQTKVLWPRTEPNREHRPC